MNHFKGPQLERKFHQEAAMQFIKTVPNAPQKLLTMTGKYYILVYLIIFRLFCQIFIIRLHQNKFAKFGPIYPIF